MRLLLLLPLIALLSGCRTNESPEGQVDDLEITAQLKSKLASDVGLSSVTNVSVNSTNGVVTLSGQVDSEEAKAKAGSVAKAVPHVVRVVNNLQVVSRKVAIACCGQSSSCC
jgi:hyperosmotically inducible protein